MNEVDRISVLDNIQALCREFRHRLKRGESATIEAYVGKVDEASREMLFQNLLHIDIEFHRRRGEHPSSEDYIKQFPQFAGLIRQAFFESTMMSQEFLGDTPDSEEPTVTLGMPAARKLGEYELLRELGRGGFGVVYEARHLQRGDRVAMKTLPMSLDGQPESSRDAERLHRFRREFRSLSEINHPNLAGMQTLEVDGNQWFFTMDLIEGVDFLQYVRPSGNLDEPRLRASLKQLVRGIIALHDEGIVHRDLKPSNVLVGAEGHVTILDFGLVAELQHLAGETLSIGTKHFAGTPRYAAPEQASGQRGGAVDWYALGTMLYEALCGDAPFKGSGVDLLIAKQTTDPPSLSEQNGVPKDLAALVDAMLRREPKERPSDQQVVDAVGVHPASSTHGSYSSDSSLDEDSARMSDQFLVGRERQLAALDECLGRFASSSQAEAVFICGRSGEGKTTLADTFLSGVRREGQMLVLAGRCYDRESVPFKAIDCLVDSLVAFLRSRSVDELDELLPGDIGMLTQLFPVLRRVEAIADRASSVPFTIDSRQIRYRGFAALRELLTEIGRRRPVILFIDDLQWGDADSAGALHEVLRPPDSPAVLLLGSYRSDEADNSQFLTEWREKQSDGDHSIEQSEIEVAPLTEEECVLLVASRLGIAPETLRDQSGELFEDTRGNPYFVEQLIEGFDAESNQFRAVPLDELIARKLDRLPPVAKSLLQTVAVAGQAGSVEEIAAVAGESTRAFATLTHMRSERLVRLIGSNQRQVVDTYHDKIRETVLSALDPSRRSKLHLRYAQWLEGQEGLSIDRVIECLKQNSVSARNHGVPSDRVFDIAHHYLEANHEHAFAYQLLTGVSSLMSYAGDEALLSLQRASQAMPEHTDRFLHYLLQVSMGRACLICKRSEEARKYLERAREFADSELQEAMAHMGLATADRFEGLFQQGIDRYDAVLRLIGTPRPRTKLGALGWILRDNWLILMAGSPRVFADPSEIKESDASILQYVALREVGPLFLEKDMLAFLACVSKACRQSVCIGTAGSMISGYEWASGFFGAAGVLPVANVYRRRAERVEQSVSDPQVREQRLSYNFAYDYWTGDLVAAEESMKRSWQTNNRLGEHNEATYRPHMLRHIATYCHPTSVELQWANTTLQLAKELGSEQQVCWGTYDVGVAHARRGDLSAAKAKLDESLQLLQSERHLMTESIRGASLAFICLQCSDYDRACELAGEAWQNAAKNLILIDVAAYSLPIFMESLAGPRWIDGIGNQERRQLRRLSWWAKLMFRMLPNHQPHLLRVLGRNDTGRGRQRKAAKRFRRSIENAKKRKMDYAEARALLDLAALSPPDAAAMRNEAISLLKKTESVIPYAERWLLGDQYDPDVVAPPPEQLNTEVEGTS